MDGNVTESDDMPSRPSALAHCREVWTEIQEHSEVAGKLSTEEIFTAGHSAGYSYAICQLVDGMDFDPATKTYTLRREFLLDNPVGYSALVRHRSLKRS